MNEFKKVFRPNPFSELDGYYEHKTLPLTLSIHKTTVLDMDMGHHYFWEINDKIVDELDDKTPEEVSDEEISLLLLKYIL